MTSSAAVAPRAESVLAGTTGDGHHRECWALPPGRGPTGTIYHQHIPAAPQTVVSVHNARLFMHPHGSSAHLMDVIPRRRGILLDSHRAADDGFDEREIQQIWE